MTPSGARHETDCPLCEGYGTLRDYLKADGRPDTCWFCKGWGKVASGAAETLPAESDPA